MISKHIQAVINLSGFSFPWNKFQNEH